MTVTVSVDPSGLAGDTTYYGLVEVDAPDAANLTLSAALRGLNPNDTLVLVNGHRINNADINSIPANAVERIEVLTDGGLSPYLEQRIVAEATSL